MRILVTGSSGHLGEALMRTLPALGHDVIGLDRLPGEFTQHIGSIADRDLVRECVAACDAILHVATLHKPHVATHAKQDFVDTNITGTLNLLEEATIRNVRAFVFTSTTSAFGRALVPPPDQPAAWIDEQVPPVPKNIYGVTKVAAEDLCELFHRRHGLPCLVLRTSRFFPEQDDDATTRATFADENAKANEFLFRRVDLEDAASAHLAAIAQAGHLGFDRFIISATTPFERADMAALRESPADVVARRVPRFRAVYAARGYAMFDVIDRVYDNARARARLGWRPHHDFATVLAQLERGDPIGSELARTVGSKGYHDREFADDPYPVD